MTLGAGGHDPAWGAVDLPGPGGDQPGGDQPGGKRPGGDQTGGGQPAGDQPGGGQPGGGQPGGQGSAGADDTRPTLTLRAASTRSPSEPWISNRNSWPRAMPPRTCAETTAPSPTIPLTTSSFRTGSLNRDSFARPGKLFTASAAIVAREAGALTDAAHRSVVQGVVQLVQSGLR